MIFAISLPVAANRSVIQDGEMDAAVWSCGMVAGLIHDIPTVAEFDRPHHDRGSRDHSRKADRNPAIARRIAQAHWSGESKCLAKRLQV